MTKTKKVHIITFAGVEFDRTTTQWEIVEKQKEGVYKEYKGEITFDFR